MELTLPRNKDIQKNTCRGIYFYFIVRIFFVVKVLNLLLC